MAEYSYELKVPKNRVAVIIGKAGSVKKEIEENTNTKLDIDSKEGDIFVSGEDALGLYTAREMIKAKPIPENKERMENESEYIFITDEISPNKAKELIKK